MRYLLLPVIMLLTAKNLLAQSKGNDYAEALKLVDIWLKAQRDYDRLPGISIAVVKDQDIIFSKGYGYANVENKVPMQPETICSICSVSKLFTSVSVMQLWEQGKLRLDDSLGSILPDFPLKQTYKESLPITVRSLLTHSSGLPINPAFSSSNAVIFPTWKEINDWGEQSTLYPASTYFQYSNFGMTLLGNAVAQVSKTSYEAYVEKNILQPLHLANTHPSLPENLWGNKMAMGYSPLHRDGTRKTTPFFQANAIVPAAGFSSTVIDLARFASWQFRLLTTGNKEILRASTLKEMQRVQWVDPNGQSTWGLGFFVYQGDGTTYIGHGGACPGYRTGYTLIPKTKTAVACMINASGTDPDKYMMGVLKILDKAQTAADTSTANIELTAYAGFYDQYAYYVNETAVVPWKGGLALLNLPSDDPAGNMDIFKYTGPDTFRRMRPGDEGLGDELRFERDANGKVVRMMMYNSYNNKIE